MFYVKYKQFLFLSGRYEARNRRITPRLIVHLHGHMLIMRDGVRNLQLGTLVGLKNGEKIFNPTCASSPPSILLSSG